MPQVALDYIRALSPYISNPGRTIVTSSLSLLVLSPVNCESLAPVYLFWTPQLSFILHIQPSLSQGHVLYSGTEIVPSKM